jgi:hypothetical protein
VGLIVEHPYQKQIQDGSNSLGRFAPTMSNIPKSSKTKVKIAGKEGKTKVKIVALLQKHDSRTCLEAEDFQKASRKRFFILFPSLYVTLGRSQKLF